MKFEKFNSVSGYGMFPETLMGRKFAPAIAFNPDDGTGAGGAVATPPEAGAGGATPPAGGTNPEDVTGLKNALDAERKLGKDLQRQLREIQDQFKDIDPTKYAQLQKLQQQTEELNQREAKFRAEVEQEWTSKVQAEQRKTSELQTRLNDLIMRTEAEKAYQASNGRSGAGEDGLSFFDLFYGSVSRSFQLNDKGQIEVIDGTGARLYSKKDPTKLMSPAEYFSTLVAHPVFGNFFERQQPGRGGGMNPNGGNLRNAQDLSHLSRADRLTALRSRPGN